MQDFAIKDISAGYYFSQPAFLDDGFILTVPETPCSAALIKSLGDWDFHSVKTDGTMSANFTGDGKASTVTVLVDDVKLNEARAFYDDLSNFARSVFSDAEMRGAVQYRTIAAKMTEVIKNVQANKRYILQIEQGPVSSRLQAFALHAVRSTIFAIIIGTCLKIPAHRLIELAIAAFVHEIGMVRLPISLTNSTSELTSEERKQIQTHPLLGFNLLKDNGFPMVICAACAEHHERENGQGYPRRLIGANISQYSKIISVVCSFEAITADRTYHLARSGFEGIIDILKNKDKGYDDTVIKALVMSVSIYPIGSFVMLSNNKKAQVVDANSMNPRYPVVQILEEVGPDGKHPVVETSPLGLNISRVLSRDETAPLTSSN